MGARIPHTPFGRFCDFHPDSNPPTDRRMLHNAKTDPPTCNFPTCAITSGFAPPHLYLRSRSKLRYRRDFYAVRRFGGSRIIYAAPQFGGGRNIYAANAARKWRRRLPAARKNKEMEFRQAGSRRKRRRLLPPSWRLEWAESRRTLRTAYKKKIVFTIRPAKRG